MIRTRWGWKTYCDLCGSTGDTTLPREHYAHLGWFLGLGSETCAACWATNPDISHGRIRVLCRCRQAAAGCCVPDCPCREEAIL
jgi:hypothetical protein